MPTPFTLQPHNKPVPLRRIGPAGQATLAPRLPRDDGLAREALTAVDRLLLVPTGLMLGGLAGAAFFALFGAVWFACGAPPQRVAEFCAWGVVSGTVAGGVTGCCRAVDRWLLGP